jgi:hypothetical protein
MADTAFQIQYRKEAIMGFEFGMSDLRSCVTTEAVIKGNAAEFVVADSGGASAVTRGVNGLIPARTDDLAQYTATLVEWHDLVRRTRFNIFASQGDGNAIMQKTTRKVMNRKIDLDIMSALATGTNLTTYTGPGYYMNLALATRALTILGVNQVPVEEEDNMFFLATPAAKAYLLQLPEFTKGGEYVEIKPLVGPSRRFYRWCGFNWIFSPLLPGVATNNETCIAFHRDAIGHAVNTGEMQALAGYHEEQDYSWARTTCFMGSQLLQNKGVVLVPHDGSAYAAV